MSGMVGIQDELDFGSNGTGDDDLGRMRLGEVGRKRREMDDSALLADGFEAALVGIGTHFTTDVAIYDYAKCVEILCGEGMSEEEALEHMEYNVTGGWVGPNTPVFIRYPTLSEYLHDRGYDEDLVPDADRE